jgi:NAD(P)-dependent dehydrogenase (short-subunit alcohol dehydrogenase family)
MSTPWTAVPSQHGRRFVVTGATSGIGLLTARVLVHRGAEVVLAVRNPEKGAEAAAGMTGPGRAVVERLDVSDLSSVEAFADRVGDVDVLVNNAGILGVPQGTSVDGVELHLATNHLGHHALALRMLPRIGDRVVVVSSNSHHHGDLDPTDLDWSRRGYRPYAAYAASKLANMLFLLELQRRLTEGGSTLRVTGAHPGTTATAITASSGHGLFTWIGSWGHHLVGMPAWRGALPTLYAATMDVPGNSYVGPAGFKEFFGWPTLVGRSAAASDPALAAACWDASVRLSGVGLSLR